MRPEIPSETQKTFKDHLFSIEISRNTERQKTLVFDLDFEKNVPMRQATWFKPRFGTSESAVQEG